MDMTHLDAIEQRLALHRQYLASEKTDASRSWRLQQIAQIEKEREAEYKFLGIPALSLDEIMMSDDELLAELCNGDSI